MSGMDIAKAGWLYRQSSILHRWKKNWFVLYRDGLLRYFESQDSPRAEEVFVLRSLCKSIKTGAEIVSSVGPPEGLGKTCMLELEMRDGNNQLLCSDSVDDMQAWHYALEEARTMQDPQAFGGVPGYTRTVPINYTPYPGYPAYTYGGYPGQVLNIPAGTQVIQTPNGTTTYVNQVPGNQVIYVDDYPYRRRGYYDAGTGFMGGALLGSTMMYPYWW